MHCDIRETLSYWNRYINSVGARTAVVVLTGDNREADQLMIRYMPYFMMAKRIDKVVLAAASTEILDSVKIETSSEIIKQCCSPEMIDGICRIQAIDSFYHRSTIFVDCFHGREDADGYMLIGSYGITIRDIVARVFLQLDHTPTEKELIGCSIPKQEYQSGEIINWNDHRYDIPEDNPSVSSLKDKVHNRIKELKRKKNLLPEHKIVIQGDTNTARACLEELHSYKVIGITDNDSRKWGEKRGSVCIIDPATTYEKYDPCIRVLITNSRFKRVCEDLCAKGFRLGQEVYLINESPMSGFDSEIRVTELIKNIDDDRKSYEEFRGKYPSQTVLLSPWKASGDIYICAMYLPEYIKKKQLTDYILVVTMPAAQRVAKMCGFDSVLIEEQEALHLLNYARFVGFEESRIINLNIFAKGNHRLLSMIDDVDWNTFHQRLVFQSDVRRTRPTFCQNDSTHWFNEYALTRDKTVLLAPYSTTFGKIPDVITAPLVQILSEAGYTLVTNVAGDEKPLEGTVGLTIPYIELIDFVNRAGAVISIRCGLCDIVSSTDSKMVVLYPEKNEVWPRYFGLERMGMKTEGILEMRLDEYPIEHMIEKIVRFINGCCVRPANI